MNKKLMLLALGAVSAMMLAVPAMAAAIQHVHLTPAPASGTVAGVGNAVLSGSGGATVTCEKVSGTLAFENGTTGTMTLTFGPKCTTNLGGVCTSTGHEDSITTTKLPFHLATVEHRNGGTAGPGVLITPGENESFAHFTCHKVGGFLTVDKTVTGNGVLGTITAPACKVKSKTATLSFAASSNGVQTHTKLAGTSTHWGLKSGEETAAQTAHATVTLNTESELDCT